MARIKCTPIELEKVAFTIIQESEPVKEKKEKKEPSGKPPGRVPLTEAERAERKYKPTGKPRGRPATGVKKVPSGRPRGRPAAGKHTFSEQHSPLSLTFRESQISRDSWDIVLSFLKFFNRILTPDLAYRSSCEGCQSCCTKEGEGREGSQSCYTKESQGR